MTDGDSARTSAAPDSPPFLPSTTSLSPHSFSQTLPIFLQVSPSRSSPSPLPSRASLSEGDRSSEGGCVSTTCHPRSSIRTGRTFLCSFLSSSSLTLAGHSSSSSFLSCSSDESLASLDERWIGFGRWMSRAGGLGGGDLIASTHPSPFLLPSSSPLPFPQHIHSSMPFYPPLLTSPPLLLSLSMQIFVKT